VKISLDWISDFVDLSGIDPETIADRLTMSTAEVEGFEVVRRAARGVVIGQVVAVEPMAGAASAEGTDNQRATVDCGSKQYVTVCGAPNLRQGMKSPFAPAGVALAGGLTIETSKVGGQVSQGVLCSPRELGMSRWHEGVLECPGWLEPGEPLARHIPAEDVVIEIDNKSLTHRPDLWGHYAFARELAAIFHRPLRPLPMVDLADYDDLPKYPLSIDDPEGCPCYGCIEFRVAAAVPSPLVIQRRLHALGQRTYNLLVDLTNYAMWELAQPTHAFDGDRVRAIRVARMGEEGTFTTLDGQERRMLPDDLLIWNEQEPVALAGVMGGLNSEVEPTTTKVLLESANFQRSRIRRTSVRLDLRTESAQRFEKGQPPVNVKLAVARILQLIADAGVDHEVTSRFTFEGDLKDDFRPLTLSRASFRSMAGADIPDGRVLSILHSLGFQARYAKDLLHVGIPPHRSEHDIGIPADVVEEVLRVYGYDRIAPVMPSFPLQPLYVNRPLRVEHKARRLLAGAHRFVEVHNYGWFDDRWLAEIGFEPKRAMALKNPTREQNRLLRTTLVPNLLALVAKNRAHRDRFRLFEIGQVFSPREGGGCLEATHLAGVSFSQADHPPLEEHFRAIKGVIEDLGRAIGSAALGFEPSPAGRAPWQIADRWVAVRQGDERAPTGTMRSMVGWSGGLGVLDGPILEAVCPDGGQVVWFELPMAPLEGPIYPEVTYRAAPIYPGSWQDFSMVWDVARGFAALQQRLDAFSHPLLTRREFLYVYKGKGLPQGKASYTYRYWIGSWDHTLQSEEISEFRDALLEFLKGQGIPLRG
jgi:phenylalanyl-tRNA synthetase beta chain